jgi:hypothetical protein
MSSSENYSFYNGTPPHQAHSETSKEAAIAALPNAATFRSRILEFIRKRGAEGATSDECQAEFHLAHQTGSARVAELLQGGFIIESGRRRKTRRGRDADVLVIAPPGTPQRGPRQRVVPKGFSDEELPQLHQAYAELCAHALAERKRTDKDATLDPLVVRLGAWIRENAGTEQ